jgi:HSP20 family molecular chaperone IbpA
MKKSDRNSDKRKQKNSFDIFADDKVEGLSSDIQNMFESLRLIEMLEEIRRNEFRANNWFAYNFIIKTSPIEESMTQKFESCPLKNTKESKEDRPSYDIITDDNEVTITIAMPDTKKENIGLWITKDTIEIMPNNPEGKYHRLINLPCNVKSKTATFTYRNGILDIIIQREKEEK